jgi:hypothetical protein
MQQLQLAIFGAAMIALVVCDCIRASSRVAGHLASCGPYSVALFWFPRECTPAIARTRALAFCSASFASALCT